ncbi:hypothetical protein J6590_030979 [Homalodisca vitripennis]|nr:hypothetical protein J6590_030979 [Homalodisca vitripennis]
METGPDLSQSSCPVVRTLNSFKDMMKVPGEVTMLQLVFLAFRLLFTIAIAFSRLVMALRPVLEMLVLLLLFIVESAIRIRQENVIHNKVFKGLGYTIVAGCLCYFAYIIVLIFALPVLTLLLSIVHKMLSFFI